MQAKCVENIATIRVIIILLFHRFIDNTATKELLRVEECRERWEENVSLKPLQEGSEGVLYNFNVSPKKL